jgi:uncharacterized protein (TIGR02611 family)
MTDPSLESFREAAIQAEYETGRREATEQAAKAHVAIRVVRITVGSIVTLAGLIMMPLPGPGLPIVAFGLAVLSRDVAWADRLLGFMRNRIPRGNDGAMGRSAKITMIVSITAGLVFSLWLLA